jgi:sporulation protein YlmC with PRC-barrel domain
MRHTLLITTALAMLVGGAYAQNAAQTGGAKTTPGAQMAPGANNTNTTTTGSPSSAADQRGAANSTTQNQNAMPKSGQANTQVTMPSSAATSQRLTFYTVQPADTRASKLIGLDVYNKNNENIGEVEDLILDGNKNVKAVVVSVGGFLGIGDRNVAIDPASVMMTEQRDGAWRLVANTTKEDLKGAPAFKFADIDKAGSTTGSASADTPANSDAPMNKK